MIGAVKLCPSCFGEHGLEAQAKKRRGRPPIRTAAYWREYYRVKQQEWRAAHQRPKLNREQLAQSVVPAAFRTEEACAYLGHISKQSLYRWVAEGLLHPSRHWRYMLFSREELDKFLTQTRNGAWKRTA
jgi:excisionase family DNA binding protein